MKNNNKTDQLHFTKKKQEIIYKKSVSHTCKLPKKTMEL